MTASLYAHDLLKPAFPAGEPLPLPGRGTTFVHQVDGPPGAATLVLLHGWMATASLNWFTVFEHLGAHFRVVALDQRGHGRGIRSPQPFSLEDCADDVAALAGVLSLERIIPVGYSLGGAVAQLVWRRHPDLVEGLVLCATSGVFRGTGEERLMLSGAPAVAGAVRLVPPAIRQGMARAVLSGRRGGHELPEWMIEEVRRHDPAAVFEAALSARRFSSHDWIDSVDVPAAVVVMLRDRLVPPGRQLALAKAIPDATVHSVPAGHDAWVTVPDVFSGALLSACRSVARRARPDDRKEAAALARRLRPRLRERVRRWLGRPKAA